MFIDVDHKQLQDFDLSAFLIPCVERDPTPDLLQYRIQSPNIWLNIQIEWRRSTII